MEATPKEKGPLEGPPLDTDPSAPHDHPKDFGLVLFFFFSLKKKANNTPLRVYTVSKYNWLISSFSYRRECRCSCWSSSRCEVYEPCNQSRLHRAPLSLYVWQKKSTFKRVLLLLGPTSHFTPYRPLRKNIKKGDTLLGLYWLVTVGWSPEQHTLWYPAVSCFFFCGPTTLFFFSFFSIWYGLNHRCVSL